MNGSPLLLPIVLLPLAGFLLNGLLGRRLGPGFVNLVGCGLPALAFLLALRALWRLESGDDGAIVETVFTWALIGGHAFEIAFYLDRLSALMTLVITGVGALIHLYSIGYMKGDESYARYFAYLNLFLFFMLLLVLGRSLLVLFVGWEGVGLASYLLIGFWFDDAAKARAGRKAFLTNRVGDAGFLLGMFLIFSTIGTLETDAIQGAFANGAVPAGIATAVGILLFIGATGKSAQIPLHVWLPDAMAGPTPVSALIHAATMVTAGVFMLARLSPIFELSHVALMVVVFIGTITAFFAATVGLVQNDIKRVIAYSTCSQLGYMFVALGMGFYSAAIFHLFTHAFFKALLFLGSGSVIHAVSDEQDMRKMGGLHKLIPTTYWMMVIGTIALTGVGIPTTIIGTAGFFSKDAIIEGAFAGHSPLAGFAFTLLVVAAAFTSFYSWRLIFMTFHGKPRASHEVMHHVHESPPVMLVPLFILAAGALFAGVIFHDAFIGHFYDGFWKGALFTLPDNHILHDFHDVPLWVKLAPLVSMVLGFVVAYQFYIRSPQTPVRLAAQHRGLYQFLLNKWYFDELYDFLFVRPAKRLGHFLWKTGDGKVIDGMGPDGISARVVDITQRVVKLQTGYLYHYAFAMLIGVAVLVTWMMLGGSF